MTTQTAQRTKRVPIAKLGNRAKPAPQQETLFTELSTTEPPPLPETVAQVLGGSMAFCYLARKNPALLMLVDALDLVESRPTLICAEPLPPLEEVVLSEALNPRLEEIAERAFARSRAYDEIEAVERLAEITATPAERARNGIARMLAQGILSLTLSNQYYLSSSTPF